MEIGLAEAWEQTHTVSWVIGWKNKSFPDLHLMQWLAIWPQASYCTQQFFDKTDSAKKYIFLFSSSCLAKSKNHFSYLRLVQDSWLECCIFWPVFGCCALQTLVKICFINIFVQKAENVGYLYNLHVYCYLALLRVINFTSN